MELKLEEAAYFDFCTHRFDTGAATDADSGPTAEVFEDATDTTVVALTVTKRTSKTGNYRVPVTAAAADGFEVGKTYNVIASATVNSVAGKGVIGRFKVRARGKDDLAYPATSGRSIEVDSSGRVNAFLIGILTSVFTEGATGRIAAAFKQFFNIASPAATMDHGILTDTTTTLTNAPSDSSGVTTLLGKFTGITLLAQWLGLIAGKQTGNSTARTELRATGVGSGTFDETTDSLEAVKDSALTAAQVNAEADTAISDAALATAASLALVPTAVQNADAHIARNIKGGSSTGRTVGDVYAAIRNRVVIDGTTITVYDTDDTTPLWTGIVTRVAADALQEINPA